LLFFFISGIHFDGGYFSNHYTWNKDAKDYLPGVLPFSGDTGPQDNLNSDIGSYFQGIDITCGIFQLWRGEGIITQMDLKYASTGSLVGTIISFTACYFHMHSTSGLSWRSEQQYLTHHSIVLLGLSSITWAAHCIHIGVPANGLLDAAIDPSLIPCLQDLFLKDCTLGSYGVLLKGPITERLFNSSTSSLILGILSAHHLSLGVVLVIIGLSSNVALPMQRSTQRLFTAEMRTHHELWINLLFLALGSIVFAHHTYALPIYPYLGPDLSTVLCLMHHHIIQGGFLIIGGVAHTSIFIIGDYPIQTVGRLHHTYHAHNAFGFLQIFNARCTVIGCLTYLCIALAFHTFGLYIHNDTLEPFERQEDMFQDNGMLLKPVFAICSSYFSSNIEVLCLHKKVILIVVELGTADLIVHHIHAFTIHIALLICMKAILYARKSRSLSAKLELGWIYPCDGPGRGGTCQISPYDHIYLAAFWAYNSVSIVVFHYFWKMQSDVWGTQEKRINIPDSSPHSKAYHFVSSTHISAGDFSVHSSTINGWLRNFLWSQAAQVIQSYGTSISFMGLIFILTHFIWAFSLMFLYSGRGYWQELIESILWAHHKLKIINVVEPRALSISQGRAVGLIHYTLGGVGCTWSFAISRMVVLS
jgi:photosystem I P700 chlorophyll a apoprotein A1